MGQPPSTSVGPSTARGMGPKGTIAAARKFLKEINLDHLTPETEERFEKELDDITEQFLAAMPSDARRWGAVRKFLNIFLRGVLYNWYLCEHFHLHQVEPWLEIPLDSQVAQGLKKEIEGKNLPRWKTVIGLERTTHDLFQTVASEVADRRGIARVHLDLFYWRSERIVG